MQSFSIIERPFCSFLFPEKQTQAIVTNIMLLRSASSPILKSCIFRSSPDPDLGMRIRTSRSISMSRPSSSVKKISRTLSDGDLNRLHISKKKIFLNTQLISQDVIEKEEELQGQGDICMLEDNKTSSLHDGLVLDEGSGGFGGGNVGIFGGGGGGDGESGQGSGSMEDYYQKMINAYPGDALVLANYAKFLKEVRGDLVKAEEYCERAILAKPDDGSLLSLYGDLIWCNYKDATRAQSYFDQAVQSSPDDSYVLASYAQFLWDAGEDDDEDEDEVDNVQVNITKTCPTQSNLFPPLTAAS